jgi:hypothetical protein
MKIEHWHRRQALCLASQLPDGPDDALAVLDLLRVRPETSGRIAEFSEHEAD